MSGVFWFMLVVCLPVILGYFAGKMGPKGDAQGCFISVLCSVIPAAILIAMSQQYDAITRAASWQMVAILFAFMCVPSGIGVAIGRLSKNSK